MRLDVPSPDAWGRLSEKYRAALPIKDSATLNVQIYAGVGHAVFEIARALATLYTHKKTIAVVSGVDPTFERVSVAFSQEGFVVKSVSITDAAKAETWAPILDELLFVLTSEDDPITGRLYPFEAAAFAGKRVFRIHVSHAAFRMQPLKRPEPFVAQILSLTPERALMVAGERMKIEPQLAPALPWPTNVNIERELKIQKQDAAVITEFETTVPAGFKPYFKADEARTFDRAVIYHQDFDGSAVIDELISTLQLEPATRGNDASLESTSSCRWESPRFNDWLLARGETEATTRGLVIIDASLIGPALRAHLETAAAKLARLQNG